MIYVFINFYFRLNHLFFIHFYFCDLDPHIKLANAYFGKIRANFFFSQLCLYTFFVLG